MRRFFVCAVMIGMAFGGDGIIVSTRAEKDVMPTADPDTPFWKQGRPVIAGVDTMGNPLPGLRSEIRSRWTAQNIYFLFRCPYDELYLKPDAVTDKETNKLWNWDVAEVFVGWDYKNIRRYKEFELSPNGEWVDLDIDRDHPLPQGGWLWNSGFKVKARIDRDAKVWYAEMQIPWTSIDERSPKAGNELRVNFFRMQGPPPRKKIVWQATHSESFHVPEAFGTLKLE